MKVSFMMITIDRFNVTPHVWKENIKNAKVDLPSDVELEFLVCDNGSLDKRIKEYFLKEDLHYFRNNAKNEGVGHAFNQLYLRSTGDFIAILGNDIKMPPGWLAKCLDFYKRVPKAGLIGHNWGHSGVPELTVQHGVGAHYLTPHLNRVFGAWFLSKALIEDLGLFDERFGLYGLEDSAMNEKVNRAGYNSFYLPFTRSSHLISDVGENSHYRKMKDRSLAENLQIFLNIVAEWDAGAPLKTPLPEMRDPLI
jgi:glycosyltransferase involved in cell wall biosynthesis